MAYQLAYRTKATSILQQEYQRFVPEMCGPRNTDIVLLSSSYGLDVERPPQEEFSRLQYV